jgi:hypothetical protein
MAIALTRRGAPAGHTGIKVVGQPDWETWSAGRPFDQQCDRTPLPYDPRSTSLIRASSGVMVKAVLNGLAILAAMVSAALWFWAEKVPLDPRRFSVYGGLQPEDQWLFTSKSG